FDAGNFRRIVGARAEGLKIDVLILGNHAAPEPHDRGVPRGGGGGRERVTSYDQQTTKVGKVRARVVEERSARIVDEVGSVAFEDGGVGIRHPGRRQAAANLASQPVVLEAVAIRTD